MKKTVFAFAALVAMVATPALAAEPIVGNWKTKSGETASIAACGGAYCVTLKTGKYAGKQIGKMSGSGNKYTGTITDPSNDKTYSGSGTISGNSISMKGCVAKILCRSEKWNRM